MSRRLLTCSIPAAALANLLTLVSPVMAQCDYRTTVIADQPFAYWRLTEAGLPLQDFAPSGAHNLGGPRPLTYGGGTFAQPGPISGDPDDRALGVLTGLPVFGVYTQNTDFPDFVASGFTLEAWVRLSQPVGSATYKHIVGRIFGHAGNGIPFRGYALQFRDNAVRLRTGNFNDSDYDPVSPGYGAVDVPFNFALNTWYHVVASADPTVLTSGLPSVTFYVNGVALGTVPFLPPATRAVFGAGPIPMHIGAGPYGGDWNGRIDEVAVYAHALNAVQVQNHYLAAGSNLALTMHPVSSTICNGGPVQFTVAATASAPIGYQWRRNLVNIDTVANPSAATAALTYSAATFAEAGQYDCVVSTPCGSLTSGAATLSVQDCGAPGATPATTFTYRGELTTGNAPAEGDFDMLFTLYSTESGAAGQVGSILCVNDIAVSGGKFSVLLDYGNVFSDTARYIEVAVRADEGADCTNATGFTTLVPRQLLTQVPQAIYAQTAGFARYVRDALTAQTAVHAQTATSATDATNAVNAQHAQTATNATSAATAQTSASATTAITAQNALNLAGQSPAYYTNLANQAGQLPWTQISGVPTSFPASGPAMGDLSGSFPSPLVSGLQGRAVAATAPAVGESLAWNGTAWTPSSGSLTLPFTRTGSTVGPAFEVRNTEPGSGYGLSGIAEGTQAIGVLGGATATSGFTHGVYGSSQSSIGRGVTGIAQAGVGSGIGVFGRSESLNGSGVLGENINPSGTTFGGYFQSRSPDGIGVLGLNEQGGWAGYFRGKAHFSAEVGIGTTTPTAALDVAGDVKANGIQVGSRVRFADGTEQTTAFPRGTIQGQTLVWNQIAQRWDLTPPSVVEPPPPPVAPNEGSVTIATDGPFTVPAGVTSILVELWGPGSAGTSGGTAPPPTDSNCTNGSTGVGGASGAYSVKTFAVTPGQLFTIEFNSAGTFLRSMGGTDLLRAESGNGRIGGAEDTRADYFVRGNNGYLTNLFAIAFGGDYGAGPAVTSVYQPPLRAGGGGRAGTAGQHCPAQTNQVPCIPFSGIPCQPPQDERVVPPGAGGAGEPGLCRIRW